MYAGHFALALALKTKNRRAPLWGLLVGVGLCDLLFGLFVLVGIERATVTVGVQPGYALDYIDWSHSLVTSALWSVLFGLLFIRFGRGVAAVMGFAVFSHFLLDLVMHPHDLALWPGSSAHLGFGLWRVIPYWWYLVETVVVVIFCGVYIADAQRARPSGRARYYPILAAMLLLHLTNSPWLSPLQNVALWHKLMGGGGG